MMGEFLYFAHRHFRAVLFVFAVGLMVLAGLGLFSNKAV